MKRGFLCLLIAILLVLPGCAKKPETAASAEKSTAKIVTAVTVQEPEKVPILTLAGMAEPAQEADLFFAAGGTITEMRVQAGSQVSRGQLLAAVDTGSGGTGSAASLQLGEANRSLAQRQKDLERIQALYDAGAASQAEWESARRDLETAENLAAQCARSLYDSQLIAPFDGTVAEVKQQFGQRTMPGTPVLHLVDLSTIKVVLSVSSDLIANFGTGSTVDIHRDGMPAEKGEVSFVAPVSDAATGKYRVEITVHDGGSDWRGGMLARVSLPRIMTSGILIPLACLGTDSDQQYVLFIENGVIKKQPVKVGQIIGNNIEILTGIKAGDRVAASGIAFLAEGDQVQVKGE